MANELAHKTVGTQLTQAEWEAVGGHVLDNQAAGDIIYGSSTSQLSKLGIGTAGQVLMTNSGASAPEWSAAVTGVTSLYSTSLALGYGASHANIDFSTDNAIILDIDGTQQIKLVDGVLQPITDNDIDLGTSSLEFKDAYFDGTITTDGLTVSSTTNLDGAIQADSTITVGVDDTGHDIKFFGATAGSYLLWDESDDALELTDSSPIKIGDGGDMQIYHDGSDSYVTNATGGLKLATETSGIAVTIGHTTSEVTIADNLTVTGTFTLGSNAELTEAELEMLDGITAGTAAASKAVVLDSSKDIATIRNLTIDGVFTDGNYTFDTSGNVSGLGTVSSGANTSTGSSSFATAVKTPKIQYTDADESMTIADGGIVTFAAGITSTAGSRSLGATSFNDADITNVADIDVATISADSNDFDIVLTDNRALALEVKEGSNTYMTFVTTNSSEKIQVGANDAGYDVIFYGDTASANMTWDTSVDDLILNGAARIVVPEGQLVLGSTAVSSTATELNLLDGVSGLVQADFTKLAAINATSTEINLIDGGTARGTTSVASGDGILINDGGTMRMTNVDTVSTYFAGHSVGGTSIVTVGTITAGTWNGTALVDAYVADALTISGGTVDNSVIGGSTAAAITGTTIDAGTDFTIGDTVITDGVITDSTGLSIAAAVDLGSNTLTTTGSLQVRTIDYSDGDLSATIADGGGITFAQDITMAEDKSLNLPHNASVKFTDAITQDSIDDHDAQGIIMTFQAGSTVTPFSPVYLHTDDEVHECNAGDIATMPCIGVSVNASDVTDGNSVEVMVLGLLRDESFTDFGTNGAPLFCTTTAGVMSNTAPTAEDDVVQIVGHSIGEKLVFVQPSLTYLTHAA